MPVEAPTAMEVIHGLFTNASVDDELGNVPVFCLPGI
jgi:hypothetical protein